MSLLIVPLADETQNPLLPARYDIVWSLVVFVVLFLLFWRFVLPAYLKVLDNRREQIAGGLERAERAQAEAAKALQENEDQLREARDEAARIREQARGEAAAIIAEARATAAAEASRITQQSTRALAAERQQAMTALRQDVGRLAVDLAGKVVGESLEDTARQRRVVDRFLAELESEDTGATAGSATGSRAGA